MNAAFMSTVVTHMSNNDTSKSFNVGSDGAKIAAIGIWGLNIQCHLFFKRDV